MARPFSKVRSAAIDGRLHNIYYRKTQLKQLFDVLVKNSQLVRNAIAEDSEYRRVEVELEFFLAVQSLKDCYNALNPERELKNEYLIANGQDSPLNREPIGIAIVEPTAHTFLYSIITAVASAIAAGNTFILWIENTSRNIVGTVIQLLTDALDNDIFAWTTEKVKEDEIGVRCIFVLQNGPHSQKYSYELVSQAQSSVIAVVERDADLDFAARALVTARFCLSGKSPYAPDLILVNESVKDSFVEAALREAFRVLAQTTDGSEVKHHGEPIQDVLERIKRSGEAKIVASGANGAVLVVSDRTSSLLEEKITYRSFNIHAVTSMDDAIDLANRSGRLLASYVFTSPASAKYLGQFVNASAVYVNQIPTQLLFGPAAPLTQPFGLDGIRYPIESLSLSKPQYINQSPDSGKLTDILAGSDGGALSDLQKEAASGLREMNRPRKAVQLGYFEQGIQTGGILFLGSILSSGGYIGYLAWKLSRK